MVIIRLSNQSRATSGTCGRKKYTNWKLHAFCTDDDENNNEMDGIEVIDLCSVSRCGNDTNSEGKETAMQESQDKSKHEEINKKIAKLKSVRDESMTKKDNVESAMMCWESTESLVEKEHRKEPEKMANKLVETTEKQKHEEEHVEPTLNTGNRLKILTEVCQLLEVSWQMCHAWIAHWTGTRATLTMSRRRSTRDERTHGRNAREPLLVRT